MSVSGIGQWLRFRVGDNRFALPVETVTQVAGLAGMSPADVPGWVGLLALRNGTLPLADGAELLGEPSTPSARGLALVLRGRFPLGFTVDDVQGLTVGMACPLVARLGLPDLTAAALPGADGPTLVLDPDRLWSRIWSHLQALPGGSGVRLLPLVLRARDGGPAGPRDGGTEGWRDGGMESQRDIGLAVLGDQVANPACHGLQSVAGDPSPERRIHSADAPAPTAPPLPTAATGDTRIAERAGAASSAPTVARVSPPSASAATLAEPPAPLPPFPHPPIPTSESPTLPLKVLVFHAGPASAAALAVPVDQVLEIGPDRPIRKLKGAPAHLAGVVEWRGRLVPVVDVAARLGQAPDERACLVYLALAGRAAKAVAARVGSVAGQALVPTVRAEAPELGVPRAWVRGVARLGRRPLAVLEPEAMVVASWS
jgi:purine-binding chemotaxis protein CheW